MAPAPKDDADIVVNLTAKDVKPEDVHFNGSAWDIMDGYHMHFQGIGKDGKHVDIDPPAFDFNPNDASPSRNLIIRFNGKEVVKFTSEQLRELNNKNIPIDPFIERRLTNPKADLQDYMDNMVDARLNATDPNGGLIQGLVQQIMNGNKNVFQGIPINNLPLQKGPPIKSP